MLKEKEQTQENYSMMTTKLKTLHYPAKVQFIENFFIGDPR